MAISALAKVPPSWPIFPEYIRHRSVHLFPEAQREYAAWLEWCFFIVAELDSTSLYVMRRHRADALGPIYGIAPEVVAKAG